MFSKRDFETIAEKMHGDKSFFSINPYKNLFGFGDYELVVLIDALNVVGLNPRLLETLKEIQEINWPSI